MPRVDLSEQGDEFETNTEVTEGGEPADKQPSPVESAIAQLTNIVSTLARNQSRPTPAPQTVSEKKQEASRAEQAYQTLINAGYKPEQLEALMIYSEARAEDVKRELEAKYESEKAASSKGSLDKQTRDRASEVVDKVFADNKEIEDEDYKQMVLVKINKVIKENKDGAFDSAHRAYAAGEIISQKDFEKAARLVSQNLGKGSAMNISNSNKGSSPGLDTRSSRSVAAAISKDGKKVDVSKLSESDQKLYIETLNATKNPELALKALRTLSGKL